jgi:hypothetical protein
VSILSLPRRARGRQRAAAELAYRTSIDAFCAAILQIRSTVDFRVSSRGWCYILEEHGLTKGDFDRAQALINDCRKSGALPLDLCADDSNRQANHLEDLDDESAADYAASIVSSVRYQHLYYTPVSFWDDLDVYVEVVVEKVDLKNLFSSVCESYPIPLTNVRGWNDLNSRAAMMRRFAHWEAQGKDCVLLYCGDHDPGGLAISDFLHQNMADLADAVGWRPDQLHIDRFGLNADFIEEQGLTWIDNLETSNGGRLDDPRHPDHNKSYVQSYLREFGARKVEANALVVRPQAGRDLCRQAILRYVPEGAIDAHKQRLHSVREIVRQKVAALLAESQS